MKIYYEPPVAEIVNFSSGEALAWISDSRSGTGGSDDIGPGAEGDAMSRDI